MAIKDKNEYLFDADDMTADFGFTFGDEEEIIAPVTDEVTDLKKRLHAVNKIFMPLLEHLAKDPEKAIIKWPNREPLLKKQMDKLKQLTDV